jgi:hypothetical protein
MAGRVLHLIFKTHLDIGFTDLSARVREQYHRVFIPQAIATATHYWHENPVRPSFIWTTGAWLIWDFLETQDAAGVRALEQAIGRGLIRWHALPFTTHSELMSPNLVRAGLSYADELDKRFGIKTLAAKMTDVPGHTRGIVPLLAEAGVRFLHLGVNSASPVPEVPDLFRWRAPDGSEVIVMYQTSYGATHFPNGFSAGIGFAHTNDNIGPQSVGQVAEVYRALRHEMSDAEIRASSLDAYGEIAWARREDLPIVELELGDSWIYGAGSDPTKMARFRALQRLYDAFVADGITGERRAFGRGLAMVAEHTCGIDVKSYLRDETAWDRTAFQGRRPADYRFTYAERSWEEQRAYLDAAINALGPADRTRADAALRELEAPAAAGGLQGWAVEIDPATGDIAAIARPDGIRIAGADASLFGYRYESYDAADVEAWMNSYLTEQPEWALLDHGKPGLDRAVTAHSAAYATRVVDGARVIDAEAHAQLGAPRRIDFAFRALDAERLEITIALLDKPANRMPEAGFLTFTPDGTRDWEFLKTGLWQAADNVAFRGGGQLQAVFAVRSGTLSLIPLDTPLVGPADLAFMRYHPAPPAFGSGLRFNLHNNRWGTNFPQWWGVEQFRARFILSLRG